MSNPSCHACSTRSATKACPSCDPTVLTYLCDECDTYHHTLPDVNRHVRTYLPRAASTGPSAPGSAIGMPSGVLVQPDASYRHSRSPGAAVSGSPSGSPGAARPMYVAPRPVAAAAAAAAAPLPSVLALENAQRQFDIARANEKDATDNYMTGLYESYLNELATIGYELRNGLGNRRSLLENQTRLERTVDLMTPEISRVDTRYEMTRRDREVAEQLLENARYDAAMDRQALYSSEVEEVGTKEYRHNQIVEQIRQLRIPIDEFYMFEKLYENLEEEDASDGNFIADLEYEYQMRKRDMLAAEQFDTEGILSSFLVSGLS